MAALYLLFAIGLLWFNLVGLGLATSCVIRHYAISRCAGMLIGALLLFFLEHFIPLGPRPALGIFTTAASAWFIWNYRHVLRAEWRTEAWFAAGFIYCLIWRYTFPNIDTTSDRMPSLAMIDGYLQGLKLPAYDRWFWPYPANFYYSFQHYSAALIGRCLGASAGFSYHLAYATMAGMITLNIAAAARRFCLWRWGWRLTILALILGGSGAIVAVHLMLHGTFFYEESVNWLGGTIVKSNFNALGQWVSAHAMQGSVVPRDLPFPPLSYVLMNGDYHTPLAGYILLTFALLIIAALECETLTAPRARYIGLLAATIPLTLISNAWTFPLQLGLVGGWLIFRHFQRERTVWKPAALGVVITLFLEFPYLRGFMQQGSAAYASIRFTLPEDHAPILGWILVFWPVVGIILLGFFNPDRKRLVRFLMILWTGALVCTEMLFNDDLYGGPWNRFNTTMKWWPWVYVGIVLSLGALHLGSRSRFCRWATVAILLPTCVFAADLGEVFSMQDKSERGKLSGRAWLERDPVIQELLVSLADRPDGVTLESGLKNANTQAPAVSLFAHKQSFLGWPWHETAWRGTHIEIEQRTADIESFYMNTLPNPLGWLANNQIRYILWLPRDNLDHYKHFRPTLELLQPEYTWHQFWIGDPEVAIGFWERNHPVPYPPP